MLKKLYVDNFKSLNNFTIDLNRVTVVIGDNAVGKSSLLQALVFLRYCCISSTDMFMSERGLSVEDVVSRMAQTSKRTMSFSAVFSYKTHHEIEWNISFITDKSRDTIKLASETVSICNWDHSSKNVGGPVLLQYNSEKKFRVRMVDDKRESSESIPKGEYRSSLISFIDESQKDEFPELYYIKKFFLSSEPLDLLSPQKMRRSPRVLLRTLGPNGDRLPALIKLLESKEKEKLLDCIRKDIDSIVSVSASIRQSGWAYIETEEKYKDCTIKVSSSNISDGTLRLLAVYATAFLNKSGGMTVLDEIEDGINVDNLKNISEFLVKYAEYCNQQVLVTTHSTILLDYIDASDIRFFDRDDNGNTVCYPFDAAPEIRNQLEFMYPGEIVLNMGNIKLSKVMKKSDTLE